MQCLLLTRYSRLGASSRVRHLQYLPHLHADGIAVDTRALLGDRYLETRYSGRRVPASALVKAYAGRLADVVRARAYDVVWLEKEVCPLLPAWAEAGLARLGIPYVVDYDDATFHYYDRHPVRAVRLLLGRKIDRVMRHAALVVAGNAYVAERAAHAGARRIEVLPSVVDLDRYPAGGPDPAVFTIGWIGTPATVHFLHALREPLRQLRREVPFRLVVVGAPAAGLEDLGAEPRPWAEETEVPDIRGFDVGIMPLSDGPWEQGKCGYKLVQYMACGKPVVASPVGINREIVQHGHNGFLADSPADWIQALKTLSQDAAGRRQMGAAGRSLVEARYCLARTAPRLARWLHEGAARRPAVAPPRSPAPAGSRGEASPPA
jgi:glycosyltransferase involved in cell wall biosynthesis